MAVYQRKEGEQRNTVQWLIHIKLRSRSNSPSCFYLIISLEVVLALRKIQQGKALFELCHGRIMLLSTYCAVFVQINQPHTHNTPQRSE